MPDSSEHRPISTSVSVGLLFTSIIWIGFSITLIIVALHAESLRNLSMATKIIWPIGALMILAGALGAWLATDELAGRNKGLLRLLAIWIWTIATSVTLGGLIIRTVHPWPIPELLAGVVLCAVITVMMALRYKTK